MLLEFKTKNFKSFLDEMDFKMVPAPKQKGLDYSILEKKIGSKRYKALCSAVIYGPNASGKTNIIGAMDVFRQIILRGHIRNVDNDISPNISASRLELIPNSSCKKMHPTSFYIKFINDGMLIEYELELDLGLFLQEDYDRKILKEKLFINEQNIFNRADDIEFNDMQIIKNFMIDEFEENKESAEVLSRNNLDSKELFLNHGFKMMFSSKLVNLLLDWFDNKFMVIYRADELEINKRVKDSKQGTIYIDKTTNEAAKIFGVNSNGVGFVVPEDGNEAKLCSIFNDKGMAIPAELFESYGTIRFVNMFPLIMRALATGSVLALDEFDANIHPMALMNIINIFHNDDINKNNAQLIFNTHNPIFLNSNLFRRDEIKFVERDDETHLSSHYALSDFKTSGKNGVRKAEDYMTRYFLGRYGAIKDVDFYDIFDQLINTSSKEESSDD